MIVMSRVQYCADTTTDTEKTSTVVYFADGYTSLALVIPSSMKSLDKEAYTQ